MKRLQPWLGNPAIESVFILAPAFIPVALVFFFQPYFTTHEVTALWWVVLVLGVDVSHVYSTLFRFYWDRKTFQSFKHLLVIIPVAGFAVALAVHLYDALLFWRLLAYAAVYHFVRQQYGFMRLYSRKELSDSWRKRINTVAIYSATIYPLLYWHISATEKIAWFVKGDFLKLTLEPYLPVFTALYGVTIVAYLAKELEYIFREKTINVPKNLVVIGTYLSWYVGIVAFQGDLIFTLLNVVAHGIPYMALIWIYGKRKASASFSFGLKGALIFLVALFGLAYVEENLWDNFVWNDHPEIFPHLVRDPVENPIWLSLLVALLVLPQVTHYVIDGFIWKFSKDTNARIQ